MKKIFLTTITTVVFAFLFYCSSRAQSVNWVELGPIAFPTNISGQINGIGRVSQIKFDPVNPLRMYAVLPHSVFVSNDTATTWAVMPGTNVFPTGTGLASICIDHTNTNVLYLGTGDANYYSAGSGVWKSTDGGASFTLSNTGMGNKLVIEILMSPTNNNVLVAATNDGLYKTTNGGDTWTLTSPVAQMSDMCMKAEANSSTLYAVASNNQNFYSSTDFGTTWTTTSLSASLPSNGGRVAVTPANPNVVYVGYVGTNGSTPVKGGIIYQSIDGGAGFVMKKGDGSPNLNGYNGTSTGQGGYNWDIEADPTDANTLYTCGHIIWKSTDAGANWVQAQAHWAYILHTDQHHLIFNPNNYNQFFNANDGGVWVNRDRVATNTWVPKSNGMAGTEFYSFGNSHGYRYLIGGGTQDNGEVFYKDNIWKTNRGGDWGSKYFFDHTNVGRAVYVENGKYRDLMNAPNGSEVSLGVPATATNNDLYAASYQDANTGFYAQSNTSGAVYGLYKTSNLQTTTPVWTAMNGFTPTSQMLAIAVSPADANVLYVLQKNKTIVRSTNALGAATFTTVAPAPLPSGTPQRGGLAVFKSGVVYMSSDGYVYRSTDQGATWTAIGTGPVTSIINGQRIIKLIADTSQAADEVVYAITAQSVYYKKTSISDWAYLGGSNLPTTASITGMDIYYDADNSSNSALRISTYGRGLWECSLQSAAGAPPVVNITSPANNAAVAVGSSFSINVTATDGDGTISKVEFFQNGIKIGEDLTAPYSYTVNNIAAGGYTFTAKATDNTGSYVTSAPVNINAIVSCPGTTYVSKGNLNVYYFDSQETVGENGAAVNAVDGNAGTIWHTEWSATVAPLPHEIQISLGTTYTVNSFKYLPRSSGSNGRVGQYEIYVSTDPMNWGTAVASGTFANDATEKVVSFAGKQGAYVRFRALSEVNGNQFTSAAEINVGICNQGAVPTVTITSPANNASFNAPANISIAATASDADGTVAKVEFYEGLNKLGEDLTAPYNFSWNNVAGGNYVLTAKAIDNAGLIGSSSAVNISVISPNTAPSVSITSPADNAEFSTPATITINANASDADGTVNKVEFFQGSTKLGEDLTAPYSFVWNNVAAGTYSLTAVATDDDAAATTSTAVTVNVVSTSTLSPIADAYVRDGNSYKNQNYGTATVLTVKKDITGQNREVFLKFDLNGVSSFNTATLRLNIASANTNAANTTWQVYYVPTDSWTETGIKWNNKPASTTLLATIQGQSSGWAEWNISAQVLSELAGDKVLSLRLVSTVINSASDVTFNSKEVATTSIRPQLLLSTTPGNGGNIPFTVVPVDFNIKAWPNPSNQEFALDITGSSTEKVHIRITNNYGQVVQQMTTTTNQVVSFGEKLKAGVYYVEVRQGEIRKLVKLIKL